MEKFDRLLSTTIDSKLGLRCKLYGYQYSEIIHSLMSVYFCGGTCIEDVSRHLPGNLSLSSYTLYMQRRYPTQGNKGADHREYVLHIGIL